jgi:hypothetical protein
MAITVTSKSCHLNKAITSLDDVLLGYVVTEENNNMVVIDNNIGDRFIIPSCKVFSVDNRNTNNLIIDVGFHEAEKYRIAKQ